MRPDLTGQAKGVDYVAEVIRFISSEWSPARLRVTVANWNKRALRVCRNLGFRRVAAFGGFRRHRGGQYVVFVLEFSPKREPA